MTEALGQNGRAAADAGGRLGWRAFWLGGAIRLDGERVWLRPPRRRDFGEWSRLRSASRAHLEPWEPRWLDDHLRPPSFARRVRWARREIGAGRAYPFFIFAPDAVGRARTMALEAGLPERDVDAGGLHGLVGGITLEHVRRGAAMSASLGYWLGEPFVGSGFMTDALRAVIRFSFEDLDVSRLEAACLTENFASRRLLDRLGFQEEGRAAAYLQIDGAWRDHLIYELRRPDRLGDAEREAGLRPPEPPLSGGRVSMA